MTPEQVGSFFSKFKLRHLAGLFGAFFMLFLTLDTFNRIQIIDPTQVGIRIIAGTAEERVLPSAWYYVPPFSEIRLVSTTEESQSIDIVAYTKENQTLSAKINVTYRVTPDTARKVILETSGDPWERFLAPKLSSVLKDELTKRTAREALDQRADIETIVLQEFKSRSTEFVVVESFSIANYDFDDSFEDALANTFVEAQAVIRAEQILLRVAKEAEATVTKATADAEATRIAAAGEADALKLKAEAIRSSPESVKLEWIRTWNGVLPATMLGNDTSIIMSH